MLPSIIKTIKTITISTAFTSTVSEALSECKLCGIGSIRLHFVPFYIKSQSYSNVHPANGSILAPDHQ